MFPVLPEAGLLVRGDPASALLMKPRSIRCVEAVAKQRGYQFRSVDFAGLARKRYLPGWRRQSRRCRRSMHHKSRVIVSTARLWASGRARACAPRERRPGFRERSGSGEGFGSAVGSPTISSSRAGAEAPGPAADVARIPGRSIGPFPQKPDPDEVWPEVVASHLGRQQKSCPRRGSSWAKT